MNYCTNHCDSKQLLQRHPWRNPPLLRTPKLWNCDMIQGAHTIQTKFLPTNSKILGIWGDVGNFYRLSQSYPALTNFTQEITGINVQFYG